MRWCGARCKNKRDGAHQVVKLGDEQKPEFIRHRGSYCERHSDEFVKMYCSECKVIICTVCFAVKHRGHSCLEIPDVAREFSKNIDSNIHALSKSLVLTRNERKSRSNQHESFSWEKLIW